MKRVLIVAPTLPPSNSPEALLAWRLVNALAEAQYEIKLLTGAHTYSAFPEFHPHIEIAQSFRHWSIFELIQVFPQIIQWRPQIIHLIPPQKLTLMWKTLPHMIKAYGHQLSIKVLSSFWQIPIELSGPYLSANDMITVANRGQMHHFSSNCRSEPRMELLGLINDQFAFRPTDQILPDNFTPFLFVPGSLKEYNDPNASLEVCLEILQKNPAWRIASSFSPSDLGFRREQEWRLRIKQSRLSGRWYFTGPLNFAQTSQIVHQASAVLTAHMKHESSLLPFLFQASQKSGRALILNSLQVEFDSFPWVHGQNALISTRRARDQLSDLQKLIDRKDISLAIESSLKELSRKNHFIFSDHATNILSRIYQSL